ncbi:MAG: hypothetical protein Q4E26_00880 [Prevotellaceae bacterium]|nr:hypothetical protein [Prevotellaceae bacterium]
MASISFVLINSDFYILLQRYTFSFIPPNEMANSVEINDKLTINEANSRFLYKTKHLWCWWVLESKLEVNWGSNFFAEANVN